MPFCISVTGLYKVVVTARNTNGASSNTAFPPTGLVVGEPHLRGSLHVFAKHALHFTPCVLQFTSFWCLPALSQVFQLPAAPMGCGMCLPQGRWTL